MSRVIGIDLGTSNARAAVMEGVTPRVIPNQEGARATPSVVSFTRNGETLVGEAARAAGSFEPASTLHGFARFIGRRFEDPDVQLARRTFPYEIVEGDDGGVRFRVGGFDRSPDELCAAVIRKVVAAAESYLGERVEEAILTTPNHYCLRQRAALKDVGMRAGLKVQRVLDASTAAALAYGLEARGRGIVAVYDLGGGHFNVSILEMQDGIYTVLSCGGHSLGSGEDVDRLIIDRLVERFQAEAGVDLGSDPRTVEQLNRAAEKAKIELSTRFQVDITIPILSADAAGPRQLTTQLSRRELERMMEPLLERTLVACRQALADAGLTAQDIDQVVLAGGQTHALKVVETIRRIFGKEAARSVDPDEAAAIGAAIQTGILQGEVTDLVLLDVTPHALGFEIQNSGFTPVIERSTNIPTKQSRLINAVVEREGIVIRILESNPEKVLLAEWHLTDIYWRPGSVVPIEVSIVLDVNGIIEVTVSDFASKRRFAGTVRAPWGLPEPEIHGLESHPTPLDPPKQNEPQRIRGQLEGLSHSVRKTLELLSSKLTEEERARVHDALRAAESTARGTVDEMKWSLVLLEVAAEELGRAMLRG